MKPKHSILFVLILCCVNLQAQLIKRTEKGVVKNHRIYFYFDPADKSIQYFLSEDGKDGSQKISNRDVFALKKSNSCNIYFQWLNPLNYRIAFKDTTYTAPSDVAIRDFFNTYLGSLAATATAATENAKKSLSADIEVSAKTLPPGNSKGVDIIKQRGAFSNKDLNLMLLLIMSADLEDGDAVILDQLLDALHDLEDRHTYDLLKEVNTDFTTLKNIVDYTKVAKTADEDIEKDRVKKLYERNITENEAAQKSVSDVKMVITNKPLQSYCDIVVKEFLKEVKTKVEADKKLIQQLRDVLTLMRQSVPEPTNSKDIPGYFRVKTVTIKDDENLETAFTVSKYELDPEKKIAIKKEDLTSTTVIFEKYDAVKVSISTGIFYASFKLRSYGVSQGTSDLTVTEDTIKTSTAIPATFLNFHFDIGSRNLLPILQFGVDPTKKRPFLLLGGGLAVPTTRFAITAGPIWTWNQSLNKLSVSQTINSSTEIEKDVKYTFDMKPKGWYLGFQFNF